MPWNDNSNSGGKPPGKPGGKPSGKPRPGPWGAPTGGGGDQPPPPRDPPTRRPSGGGNPPPDFNQLSRQVGERVRTYFGGHGSGPQTSSAKVAGAIAAGLVGLWILSGIYTVQTNQRAVVTTFGAYSGQAGPGLNYHAPFPIQRVKLVRFTTLSATQVGGDGANPVYEESLMLTGDQNIVDLKFTVQWRVSDAYRYVFNVKNTDEIIKSVAESAMREVVGRTDLQTIITNGQRQVQTQTAQLMQRILDGYGAGVYVDEVQINSANSPPKVLDAFREVAAAKQEADAIVNKAQGDASAIVNQAKGYKAQVVQEAQGEAARFDQVYQQYKAAPAITRQRLYTETMEKVLQQSNNIIVDSKGANMPLVITPDALQARGMQGVVISPQGVVR